MLKSDCGEGTHCKVESQSTSKPILTACVARTRLHCENRHKMKSWMIQWRNVRELVELTIWILNDNNTSFYSSGLLHSIRINQSIKRVLTLLTFEIGICLLTNSSSVLIPKTSQTSIAYCTRAKCFLNLILRSICFLNKKIPSQNSN